MIDMYLGLIIALLILVRRMFYKGSNLCVVSVISFILIFIIGYSCLYYPILNTKTFYIVCIIRGAIISSLILLFSSRDHENHNLWVCFLFLTFLTMLLDYFKYNNAISNSNYIILGRTSSIIEILLINIKFTYAQGTGFLKNTSGGHPFFCNVWSFANPNINRFIVWCTNSCILQFDEKNIQARTKGRETSAQKGI